MPIDNEDSLEISLSIPGFKEVIEEVEELKSALNLGTLFADADKHSQSFLKSFATGLISSAEALKRYDQDLKSVIKSSKEVGENVADNKAFQSQVKELQKVQIELLKVVEGYQEVRDSSKQISQSDPIVQQSINARKSVAEYRKSVEEFVALERRAIESGEKSEEIRRREKIKPALEVKLKEGSQQQLQKQIDSVVNSVVPQKIRVEIEVEEVPVKRGRGRPRKFKEEDLSLLQGTDALGNEKIYVVGDVPKEVGDPLTRKRTRSSRVVKPEVLDTTPQFDPYANVKSEDLLRYTYGKDAFPNSKARAKGKTSSNISPEDLITARVLNQATSLGEATPQQRLLSEYLRAQNAIKIEREAGGGGNEEGATLIRQLRARTEKILKELTSQEFEKDYLTSEGRKELAKIRREYKRIQKKNFIQGQTGEFGEIKSGIVRTVKDDYLHDSPQSINRLRKEYSRLKSTNGEGLIQQGPVEIYDEAQRKYLLEQGRILQNKTLNDAERQKASEILRSNQVDREETERQSRLEGEINREAYERASREQSLRTTVIDPKKVSEQEAAKQRIINAQKEREQKIRAGILPADTPPLVSYYDANRTGSSGYILGKESPSTAGFQSPEVSSFNQNTLEAKIGRLRALQGERLGLQPPELIRTQDLETRVGQFLEKYITPTITEGPNAYGLGPKSVPRYQGLKPASPAINAPRLILAPLTARNNIAARLNAGDLEFDPKTQQYYEPSKLPKMVYSKGYGKLVPEGTPEPTIPPRGSSSLPPTTGGGGLGNNGGIGIGGSGGGRPPFTPGSGGSPFSGDDDYLNKYNKDLLRVITSAQNLSEVLRKNAEKSDKLGLKDEAENARRASDQMLKLANSARDLDASLAQNKAKGRIGPYQFEIDALKEYKNELEEGKRVALDANQTFKLIDLQKHIDSLTPQQQSALGYNSGEFKGVTQSRSRVLTLAGQYSNLEKDKEFGLGPNIENQVSLLRDYEKQLRDIQHILATSVDQKLLEESADKLKILNANIEKSKAQFLTYKSVISEHGNEIVKVKLPTIEDSEKQVQKFKRDSDIYVKQLNSLSKLKNADELGIKFPAIAAAERIEKLQKELKQLEKFLETKPSNEFLGYITIQTKELGEKLDVQRRKLQDLRTTSNNNPAQEENKGGVIGALGGIASHFVYGPQDIYYGLQSAFSKGEELYSRAVEVTKANRELSASALEAGVSYEFLNKQNTEFADKAGLSKRAAQGLTSQIAQYAGRLQRPGDTGVLGQSFLNIGTARGLDPDQIEQAVRAIIAGQRQGYQVLGLKSPATIASDYEKETGKKGTLLTVTEKAQLYEQEILNKGELFKGTAEARMASLDGRAAKLGATLENLKDTIAVSFASSYDVTKFIEAATGALKSFGGEVDDIAIKVKRGINVDQLIHDQSKQGTLSYLGYLGARTVLQVAGGLGTIANTVTGRQFQGLNDSGKNLAEYQTSLSPEYQEQQREDYLRQQVNAQILYQARQKQAADAQKVDLAGQSEEEKRTQDALDEKQKYEEIFKRRSRTSPQEIQSALNKLDRVQNPLAQVADANVIRERSKKEFDQAQKDRNAGVDNYAGLNDDQVKAAITKQVTAEEQEKANVRSQPLFDEETKKKLIEEGKRDLSESVNEVYRLALKDPRISITELFKQLAAVKSDTRLFPESEKALEDDIVGLISRAKEKAYQKILTNPTLNAAQLFQQKRLITEDKNLVPDTQESLLLEVERKRDEFAKKMDSLKKDFRNLAIGTLGETTDNPFVKLISDVGSAFDDAKAKFLPYGENFANMAAKVAAAAAQSRLALAEYQSSDKALVLRQQARNLANTPSSQLNSYERRLSEVQTVVSAVQTDQSLTKGLLYDKFLSSDEFKFDRSGKIDKSSQFQFYKNLFGEDKAQDLQQDLRRQKPQDREKFLQTQFKIEQGKQDFQQLSQISSLGLGAEGQGAIAQAELGALPTTEDLIPRLGGSRRNKEEAQDILAKRAEIQQQLREANAKKLQNYVENQRYTDSLKQDAVERIKNLNQAGGLSDKAKLDQFLTITGDIPVSEQTPEIRQGRIKGLLARATLEDSAKDAAATQLKDLANGMKLISDQLNAGGLKVDTGDAKILDVNISLPLGSGVTETNDRPNSMSVTKKYG